MEFKSIIETEIKSVTELERWLCENNYPLNHYSINGNMIHEGYGLENNGGLYQWFYTERGVKQTLKYFSTEQEAVNYALKQIKSEGFPRRNTIETHKPDEEV